MVIFLALLWGWGLAAPQAAAAPPPATSAVMQQALQELGRENYEEALALLTKAWQERVRTPEAAFLLGRTYRAMLNYQEARWYLQEALRLKPGYREAQLLLADTLVGIDQADQAIPILKELEATGYAPGHTSYISGLAYYKEKNYSTAVQYFQKAQQDPNIAQDAKFQEAMALAAQNRLLEAKQTMVEAIGLNPESATAGFAEGYAASLDRRLKDYKRLRFTAFGGFDYDSNVSLQPGEAAGSVPVSGKNDVFWSLTASLEYNLMRSGKPFALWAYYGYYQNFHHKLTDFDLFSSTTGVVPSYTWEKSRLWMPYAFNYSLVGYQPYVTSHALSPTYLYLITPKIGVEAGAQWAHRDYWFETFIDEDDRSGDLFAGTLACYYFLKKQEGYLQARFSYERDFTRGRNWDSNAYRFTLALLYPVNEKWKIRASGEMILQPYDNNWFNGIPSADNPKRYDNIFIGGLEITRIIYKGWEINAHCYYIRDESNIALYDYDRVITGMQLGYRY